MAGGLRTIIDWGRGLYAAVHKGGAGALPPVETPKVRPKQASYPSYVTNTAVSETALPQRDRRLANTNLEDYRSGANTRTVIRDFVASSPDLSAAVNAYLRASISETYTAVARNMDGTFNREATMLAQQILTRFDIVGSYEDGFSGVGSMRSNSESLGKELLQYGSMCAELVLDKARLPRTIAPVSTTQISFKQDDKWLKPVQTVGGVEIDLDQPTFFYVALDQDLTQAYSDSPLESAVQSVLFSVEFMNDLRRIVKRAIHPRLNVKINEDKFKKSIPPDVAADQDKLTAYMNSLLSTIEGKINGLKPEDALVFFDTIGVEYMNNGNQSLDAEYKVLMEIINAKLATGAKVQPSVLGHGTGSQNIASTETLMFMKNAAGSVQLKLNEFYSKILTLAVRLFGQDVYVEFKYGAIELRPAAELEAYRAMHQSRILEQLSLGFIQDDEASIALTGQVTPAGFKPLSGTGFHQPTVAGDAGNPASNQNSKGPQNRRPATPEQKKGPQKAAQIEGVEISTLEASASIPALTADEVRAVVEAALATRPGPDVEALLVGLQARVEARLSQDLAGGVAEVLEELRATADALRQAAGDQAVTLAVQLGELSGRVAVLSEKEHVVNVEVGPANVTVHNEAAKPGVKTVTGQRGKDGKIQLTVHEES